MKKLFAFLLMLPTIVWAQNNITEEAFYLHKSKPDAEEDIDSRFPIIKSTNPAVAKNINTVLQLESFGMILTDKRKADLFKAQDHENAAARDNMEYSIGWMNARVIWVDIKHYILRNAMSLNGDYQTRRFYFDAATGQQLHFFDFFTNTGFGQLKQKVADGLLVSFVDVMKRYEGDDFSAAKMKELEEECGCDCQGHLSNAFCLSGLMMDLSDKTISISIPDCDWMNPRNHDRYDAELSLDELKPMLSEYGKYMLFGGAPVANPSPFYKLWKGKLGTSIATTFYLIPDCSKTGPVGGTEIYDNFGQRIALGGSFTGYKWKFSELDGEGKAVATFEATMQNGKLVGTWKKADGSKTLPFEAVPANP